MKKYYTQSDAGGVRVGNDRFTVIIPNGYGDGTTTVHILDMKEASPEMEFFTSFDGENINIYAYDCGGDAVVATISGRFGAYRNNKNVYFIRWE